MTVFVIAEAGVNHNGDPALALRLVDVAAEAGADAVKFQTFRADEVAVPAAPKAAYQKTTTDAGESQLDMIRGLELSADAHRALVRRCRERNIRFLSTPFDLPSLAFLVEDLALETLKIPSGEITNGPLLLAAGRSGCDIILSTGMADLAEIETALGVLAFGMLGGAGEPGEDAFRRAYESAGGKAALRRRVTLMHCTTAYPAPVADVNLAAMATMADAFGLPVGYSDHTAGITVPVAATARGATAIEKHFTTDRTLPGPDHAASLEPDELSAMVDAIRATESAIGDGVKGPAPSELDNMPVARKSLVTLKAVRAGEPFTEANLGVKRPGDGISPMAYWRWLGREAPADLPAGTVLTDPGTGGTT